MKKVLGTVLALYGGLCVGADIFNKLKDYQEKHKGTNRILVGGVWEDDNNNIYNCHGEKVGKVFWEDGVE